ncbi:Dysbindin-A-like isoform X3 [Oopsacas minuta]|uniref:Dysbindin-A-like isoform X3 n=1 Tax=Oopsacas minuta TaxID=111878 RepID=A0AAV7KGI1_9METZ|nr:Dysbindin-A-like isoform X3 [Oopsacas minuta]
MSGSWPRPWQTLSNASHSLQEELSREVSTMRKFATNFVKKRTAEAPGQEDTSEVAAIYTPRVGYELVAWNAANLAEIRKRAVKSAGEGDRLGRVIARVNKQAKKSWKVYNGFHKELQAILETVQMVDKIRTDLSTISDEISSINFRLIELDLLNAQVQMSRAKMEEFRRFSVYKQTRQEELKQMDVKLKVVRDVQRETSERQRMESLAQKQRFLAESFQQQMLQYKEYGTLRPGMVDRKFQGSSEYDKQLGEVEIEGDVARDDDLNKFLSDAPSFDQPEILTDIEPESASPVHSPLTNERLMHSLLEQKMDGKKIGDVQDESPASSGLDKDS